MIIEYQKKLFLLFYYNYNITDTWFMPLEIQLSELSTLVSIYKFKEKKDEKYLH